MSKTKQVKIPRLECQRCGHKWIPRKPTVVVCPTCKSPYWDKPKEENTAEQTQDSQ